MHATFTPRRTAVEVTPVMSQRKSASIAPAKNAPMTPAASAAASRRREPGLLPLSRRTGTGSGTSFWRVGTLRSVGVTGATQSLKRLHELVDRHRRESHDVERHGSSFLLAGGGRKG